MSSAPAPGGAFDRYVQRGGAPAPAPASGNTVFKSGHLFISSKGLGWKSWKKRWFILTRTSLVFFKSDPNTLPQRSGEVNVTLGGIDLNNSGSVVVREDKKLLTHVLRELPSSPVPASCCTALLEAFRMETKEARINAMRSAISETFPEPNRRLLQRILKMMYTVASHTAENRMTASAVAACMAPLLLRPLLAGECEMDEVFDMDGDDSAQLLAAANAANSAQGIVATLLEEYESIFDVSRLQEQLQAERDLRSALEVGLSMSSGQFSSPRAMDSKLNQQRQHQYGPSPLDGNDRYHRIPGHFSQQNFVQPGFDMKVAFCNQEKQRNEESSMDASQWRNIKQHVLPYGSSRPLTRKLSLDASSSDSRGIEASTSMSSESTSVVINIPKLTEGVEYGRQPMVASSTLVELTTRLDFFKERRSQLMEQLHSLDLGHGSASQGFPYKPPSPWNSPR
uniref:Uncharacterized protein n=1 Tax=Avena sativa TaxID=4498 RepID=A0ACD5XL06_AVESA